MSTAFEFLKANPVFHLATIDGEQARVRPFGFSMIRNNKFYMCTNKTKDVYKQMVKCPNIEFSAMGTDGTWLRVSGKVAFDDSRESKAEAFKVAPNLLQIYAKGADDEIFITFYFTEAKATLYSFQGGPKNIPLF